jgi:hypothetical protein
LKFIISGRHFVFHRAVHFLVSTTHAHVKKILPPLL